jgi:hypothetical protein
MGAWVFAINVAHVPPDGYTIGVPSEFRLEVIQGWEDITGARIIYRPVGQKKWFDEDMTPEVPSGPWMTVSLPMIKNAPQGVEYYFDFTLNTGNVETLPIVNPTASAFVIQNNVKRGSKSQAFVKLNDEPTADVKDGYVLVISYFDIAEQVDPNSIKLFIDGIDVTEQATISGNALLYRDEKAKPGSLSAFVTAHMLDGTNVYSDTWLTDIVSSGKKQILPIDVRGNFNVVTNAYGYDADSNAPIPKTENDAATYLDLYGKYGILDMQTNLYVSSLERENRQPVNRYTIGLQVPMLDVFLGDYSPSFTPFTMSNKNLRGLFTKFDTKFFGLQWAHGEMVRDTKGTIIDATNTPRNTGTFRQEAIAARMRFGTEDGFSLGFNGVRNRDIISSLDTSQYSYRLSTDPAADTVYTAYAQDNIVFSIDAKLNLPAQNVSLGIEGAGSMHNKNTLDGPMTQEEIEEYLGRTLPFDPSDYSSLFVINKNIEPFEPGLSNIAWKAYYRAFILNNLFNISYSQIGSSFNATSTNYMQNDNTLLSITDQYNYKQYLFLTGGYTRTEDNLSGHRFETNTYDSWFVQSIVRIPRYPYFKAAYFSNVGKNTINNDVTEAVDFTPYTRNSNSLSLGMGYNFVQIPYVPTQLDITWRAGGDDSSSNDVLTYDNVNSGINFSLTNKYTTIPLKTQIAFSSNNQELKLSNNAENSNFNIMLHADYMLWENKLKPYMQYRNVSLGGDQQAQSYSYYICGLEAYPIKDMTISTSLTLKNYQNDDVQNVDYGSTTWRLSLNQRF